MGILKLWMAIAIVLAGWIVSDGSVQAQSYTPPAGTRGWCTPVGPGQTQCLPSPAAACQAQWQAYGQPYSPPAGPLKGFNGTSSWAAKECDWDYSASPAPTVVVFECVFPATAVAPGRCVSGWNNFPECVTVDGAPNFGAYPAPCTPRPINLLSGSKSFGTRDFDSANGMLRVDRYFNSFAFGGSPGTILRPPVSAANWRFGFSVELQLTSAIGSGIVTVLMPEGLTLQFIKQTNGSLKPYTTDAYPLERTDFELELVGSWPPTLTDLRTAASTWTLRTQQATWTLQTRLDPELGQYVVGYPAQMAEREGPTWTFDYGSANELESLEDQFGNRLEFTWLMSTAGAAHPAAISRIDLPGGFSLRYEYEDAEGGQVAPERLMSVEWRDPLDVVLDQTSYVYGDSRYPTFVTEIRDRTGVGRQAVAYQEDGKAVSSAAGAGAEPYEVAYASAPGVHTRTVEAPLGRQIDYEYSAGGYPFNTALAAIDEAASPNAPATSTAFGTTGRQLTSETDSGGRQTTYERDAVGRPLEIVEAANTASARTTTITWHSSFNVPTQVVRPGLTIDLTYDAAGRILTRTLTDTTTGTSPYPTNGRTRTWTYDWSSTGLLERVDGPLAGTGDTISYTYSMQGWLASTTNAVGLTTTVTAHDWRGEPLTLEDENGVETAMTYDVQGRPLTITIDPGPTQSAYVLEYDAGGNVSKVTLPGGAWLAYDHDAGGRLLSVENDRGESQTYSVNAEGQPTSRAVRDASSALTLQQAQVYDELGRVIEAIGAAQENWAFAYDAVGNLVEVVDARGEVWTTAWDPLNRVITETDPETVEIELAYAPNNQLTSLEDGRDLTTTRVVDGFGDVIFESSPDRGDRTYWYDAESRLTQMLDADGVQTTFVYDAAGRRVADQYTGASWENVAYTYDDVSGGNFGRGRLTGVTDASGTSAFRYDAQGRLMLDTRTIGVETYAAAYTWDASGEIASITYPSGHVVTYTRDPEGRVTDIDVQETSSGPVSPVVSAVQYAPFGPLTQLTHGNGLGLVQSYDDNYWQTGLQVGAPGVFRLDLTFARDDDGALTGVTDNLAGPRSAAFGYTDAGRLQYAVGAWGDESYSYDAAGNRVEVRRDDGGLVSYAFAVMDSASNQVREVRDTNWSLLREFSYRDGGDLYAQDTTAGPDLQYHYGAAKRMLGVTINGVDQGIYRYDYAGRRVSRELPATSEVIHYVFDPDGRLLAEHDGATGDLIRAFVWLDDQPAAILSQGAGGMEIHYLHLGQLGEPLMITDATQAVVWDGVMNPWGEIVMTASPAEPLDWRLPGQTFQPESGLLQNWMRDYDPALARYVQVDPLGLEAGQNLYAYVDGDPLVFADFDGRSRFRVAGVIRGLGMGLYNYFERWRQYGHDYFPGEANSAQRHCTVSCITGARVGTPIARTFGIGNELIGFARWDVPQLPSRLQGRTPWAFQWSDLRNNERGFRLARCIPKPLPVREVVDRCRQGCAR